jgi:hypothetical protein
MRREEMKALFPLTSVSFEQVEMALDKLDLWEREERPGHIVEGEGEIGDYFGDRFLCRKKDKFPLSFISALQGKMRGILGNELERQRGDS